MTAARPNAEAILAAIAANGAQPSRGPAHHCGMGSRCR